ncbi:MAG: hypothetical protein LBQ49_03075 [Rickettsiales bacterium]|nr:hypothetical protein [Rickettsiales bacterium]
MNETKQAGIDAAYEFDMPNHYLSDPAVRGWKTVDSKLETLAHRPRRLKLQNDDGNTLSLSTARAGGTGPAEHVVNWNDHKPMPLFERADGRKSANIVLNADDKRGLLWVEYDAADYYPSRRIKYKTSVAIMHAGRGAPFLYAELLGVEVPAPEDFLEVVRKLGETEGVNFQMRIDEVDYRDTPEQHNMILESALLNVLFARGKLICEKFRPRGTSLQEKKYFPERAPINAVIEVLKSCVGRDYTMLKR